MKPPQSIHIEAALHVEHRLSAKHPAHCAAPCVSHAANAPVHTRSPLSEQPPGVAKHGFADWHSLHRSERAHELSGKHPMVAHCAAPCVTHAANAPVQTRSPLFEQPPGVAKHGFAAMHALHGPTTVHELSGKHPISPHCAAPCVSHAANAPVHTRSPLAEQPPGVAKHGVAA